MQRRRMRYSGLEDDANLKIFLANLHIFLLYVYFIYDIKFMMNENNIKYKQNDFELNKSTFTC